MSEESSATAVRPWRVLIADDDAMARRSMAEIIGSQPDLEVVAEASDGAAAIEAARLHHPDVVLMDVNMPRLAGAEATQSMLAQLSTNVIAITSWTTQDVVDNMLIAGAMGFLQKDQSPRELIDGVRTVARGDGFVSPAATAQLIRRHVQNTADPARLDAARRFETLSAREREIARHVAAGASNPEIADRLHLSLATVKTHLEQLGSKLGAENRTRVAVMVERAGFGSS